MWYYYVIAAAVLVILLLIYFHLETRRFATTRYRIASKELPEAFSGTRIALLTDLHNNVYGTENKKLFAAIDKENPDMILVAGDMLVARREDSFLPAVKFLDSLARKYPVYYSYGNHESRLMWKPKYYGSMGRDYEDAIAPIPMTMLHNQKAVIEKDGQRLFVYGLEISKDYYYRLKHMTMTANYVQSLLGEKDENTYSILIAHSPNYFDAYSQWGADLVVSGHHHGGIARLPFFGGVIAPNYELFPEYDRGEFKKRESVMILSGGIGSHSPKFRAFNPPELVMIELSKDGELRKK